MNDATKAEVLAAVAKWRPRLRLNDWSMAIEWDSKETDFIRVHTEERYRRFKIHVAPTFPNLTTDDIPGAWLTLEKMVLHELCHVITAVLHVSARSIIRTAQLGKAVEEQAFDRMDDANELLTEMVARLLWEAWEGTSWDTEP